MSDLTVNAADDFEFELVPLEDTLSGQILKQTQRAVSDPLSQAFPRKVKATANTDIQWQDPTAETDIKEVPFEIQAVRGIMLSSAFGFMLYDDKENKVVCTTVSAEPMGAKITKSQPMSRPIYSPVMYNTENTPATELKHWNPMGSRGEYCAECVFNKRHELIGDDGKPRTCGLTSSVLFYVLAVGSRHFNRTSKEVSTRWTNLVDVDAEGVKIFPKPVILDIQISRFGVMKSLTPGKLMVKNVNSGGMAPEDAQTLRQFVESAENRGKVIAETRTGLNVINGIVEMYAAQPADAYTNSVSAMIKSIPVFSINEDAALNENLSSTIKAGLREYVAQMSQYNAVEYGKPVPVDSTPTIVQPMLKPAPNSESADSSSQRRRVLVSSEAPATNARPVTQVAAQQDEPPLDAIFAEPIFGE